MTDTAIKVSRRDKVLEVVLDRPPANAVDAKTSRELGKVFEDFRDDPDLRVAIITGAGAKFFCAGWDLQAVTDGENTRSDFGIGGFAGLQELPNLNKPIISAINGICCGGGLELALACDIIVISENAEVGLPEPTVGLIAGAGGVHRLPRHIPLKKAMGMLLTARRISATEAYEFGLVNEVVPLSDLMTSAERWANQILACAPLSIRASKQMAYEGLSLSFGEAFKRSYTEEQKFLVSSDRREGPLAFSEKRKPNWTGS